MCVCVCVCNGYIVLERVRGLNRFYNVNITGSEIYCEKAMCQIKNIIGEWEHCSHCGKVIECIAQHTIQSGKLFYCFDCPKQPKTIFPGVSYVFICRSQINSQTNFCTVFLRVSVCICVSVCVCVCVCVCFAS